MPSKSVSLRCSLILSCHPWLALLSGLFTSGFLDKILYGFLIFHTHATWPTKSHFTRNLTTEDVKWMCVKKTSTWSPHSKVVTSLHIHLMVLCQQFRQDSIKWQYEVLNELEGCWRSGHGQFHSIYLEGRRKIPMSLRITDHHGWDTFTGPPRYKAAVLTTTMWYSLLIARGLAS